MSSYGGATFAPDIPNLESKFRTLTLQLNVLLRVLTFKNVVLGHRQGLPLLSSLFL